MQGIRTCRRKTEQRKPGRRARWAAALFVALLLPGAAAAAELPVRGELAGAPRTYVTKDEDTLLDVARREELGYIELRAANPDVDPWLPGEGTVVTLPTAIVLPDAPRRGIVINLPEQRLYYFRGGPATVVTYPVGIPARTTPIPLGTTKVVAKRPNPTWFPPPSLRKERPDLPESIPPGPDNPLGAFAISLAWPSFVIHGTNKPDGVGRRVSHGCIRLYPENIEALYGMVPEGTPVTVVNQPIKAGWSDGALYLEVHPLQDEAEQVEADGRVADPAPLDAEAERLIRAKAGGRADAVDWTLVRRVVRERRGIPVQITPGPPTAQAGAGID
jgi:L,D-transpeptidase ErfK/SrfK